MNPTDIAWAVAIVGLLVFEAWTLANKRANDTLSEGMWRVAYRRPLVPFMVGLLMGHFFWQADRCADALRDNPYGGAPTAVYGGPR